MSYLRTLFFTILLSAFLGTLSAFAQTHYVCVTNTGNNATLAIPSTVNPTADGAVLASGDEIAVFANDTLCVGVAVWEPGQSASITVWGDNDQTPEKDGISPGENMIFQVWVKADDHEYHEVEVTYLQGDGVYSPNGIYVLATLIAADSPVTVEDTDIASAPEAFSLQQNYPNPFNPETTISFTLPKPSAATLKVYSVTGSEVQSIFLGRLDPGEHRIKYSAKSLPSGIYFYSLQAGSFIGFSRMTLVK